ncbi:MAG: hypothetical protein KF760_16985 [Candidatus Eremiobacteraeota bacterium]|nr:hypothetical protein [Candidatus Eremiobacteraeota bacterium]MCW5870134.1 hypothetical protein [Candidatus Eremiobacteraeota bacterium]
MESSGRFQIDLKAAVRQLGRYLLPNADDAFLKLVQYGLSQSAQGIALLPTPTGFMIHFLGVSEETPADQMLSQMPEILSGEVKDDRRPLFAGLNYFLHHGVEVALTVVHGGKVVDSARSGDFPQQIARYPPDARFLEALSLELFARTVIEFEEHSMRQRLAYCPIAVTWKGKQLSGDRQAGGCWPAHGQPIQAQYSSNGKKRAVLIQVEVDSERQRQAEVIPLQWGVALDPVPYSAGAAGIRLIVPANEVETQLGAFKMKPCPAWAERDGVVTQTLETVADSLYGKGRNARKGYKPRRQLGPKQAYALRSLIVFALFDLLVMVHDTLPASRLDKPLDVLAGYLPHMVAAQILWILYQLLI